MNPISSTGYIPRHNVSSWHQASQDISQPPGGSMPSYSYAPARKKSSIFGKVWNYFKGIGMALIGMHPKPKHIERPHMSPTMPEPDTEAIERNDLSDPLIGDWSNTESQQQLKQTDIKITENDDIEGDALNDPLGADFNSLTKELKAQRDQQQLLMNLVTQRYNDPLTGSLGGLFNPNNNKLDPNERPLF